MTATLRPRTDEATTELRHLVADCIIEASDARGVPAAQWMTGVTKLQDAVTRLDDLRSRGGSQTERSHAADQASMALLAVVSVYDDARARLEDRLADRPDLADLRESIGQTSHDIVDPVLHGQLAEQVCRFLEARTTQLVVTL